MRLILVFSVEAFLSGLLPTVVVDSRNASGRHWEEFCVLTDETRLGSLWGSVFEQDIVAHASVVVFFSGVVVAGFVGLFWRLFGRTNACVIAVCFPLLLLARQPMRGSVRDEMGHCGVDGGGGGGGGGITDGLV